jgi:hypothetical protein
MSATPTAVDMHMKDRKSLELAAMLQPAIHQRKSPGLAQEARVSATPSSELN